MKKDNAKADTGICVGVITSVNGVRGHVKIRSFTEKPTDIANFTNIFDDNNNSYKVSIVTTKKDYVIAGIEGINNRNEAEKLRSTKLYIKRSELSEPGKDQFYHADLIGVEARSEEGVVIGIIKNLVNFGAGDILEVYDMTSEKVVYYPFTKQFIPEINIQERYLILKPLEEIVAAGE